MKSEYKKIDIYLRNTKGVYTYECSTTWSRTCKDAKMRFLQKENYLDQSQVKAVYAKE
jgi:hypothetical protein